jgi:hypothetical protein
MVTSKECLARWGQPVPTAAWESKLLVSWDVPQSINDALPALPNRIYTNKLMVLPLETAFRNLIQRGFAGELKTWDGSYNIRLKRGQKTLSLHCWAVAVDLNRVWNDYGAEPTLSAGFVKCFEDAGFDWGGYWAKKDGMHFQLQNI